MITEEREHLKLEAELRASQAPKEKLSKNQKNKMRKKIREQAKKDGDNSQDELSNDEGSVSRKVTF